MTEDKYSHFIPECDSPKDEINYFAKSKDIEPNELDFRVVEIFTYIKTHAQTHFNESKNEKLQNYLEKEYWDDASFKIKQKYAINIVSKNSEDSFPYTINIISNRTKTKIDAVINIEDSMNTLKNLESRLYDELIRRKIRHGLLVFDFDHERLKGEVVEFAKLLKRGDIEDEYTINLCSLSQPKVSVDAKIRYIYREKNKKNEGEEKVDYKERDFMIAVKEDEEIIEVIKPQKGDDYRDCAGVFVKAKDPTSEAKIDFNTDETIEQVDEDNRVVFIAARNGYVSEENSRITIKEEMEINEVSFKNTGSLRAGIDSGMVVRIEENNFLKESIGEGLSIEVSEVYAAGNIGSGVEIKAREVEIGGQTHMSSNIYADTVHIAIHKGYVKAKEVFIGSLEGGVVDAQTCEVEKSLSGVIRAQNVFIEDLHSHSRIYASNKIEIDKISGDENRFFIDPKAYYEVQEEIEEIEKQNALFLKELSTNQRELQKRLDLISQNRENIESIKEKIADIKRKNGTPPKILLDRIKKFKFLINGAKEIRAKIAKTHKINEELKSKIEALNSSVLDAKILVHDKWRGFNEIKFMILEPKQTFIYKPKERDREIRLIKKDQDLYEAEGFEN